MHRADTLTLNLRCICVQLYMQHGNMDNSQYTGTKVVQAFDGVRVQCTEKFRRLRRTALVS